MIRSKLIAVILLMLEAFTRHHSVDIAFPNKLILMLTVERDGQAWQFLLSQLIGMNGLPDTGACIRRVHGLWLHE